jgi:hypothetical protein
MILDSLNISTLSARASVWYFLDGYTEEISGYNWAGQNYNIYNNGLMWDTSGFQGDGVHGLLTYFNANKDSSNFKKYNNSFAIFSKTDGLDNGWDLGCQNYSNGYYCLLSIYKSSNPNYMLINNSLGDFKQGQYITADKHSNGFFAVSLTDSLRYIINGIQKFAWASNPAVIPNEYWGINGYYTNNSMTAQTSRKYGLVVIGAGFTAEEYKKILNIYYYWWANKHLY